MTLIKASSNDLNRLCGFYKYVVENTHDMDRNCRWIYGKHPSDTMIEDYIKTGCMYYSEEKGSITSAVAVTMFQTDDYHEVNWSRELNDDEVAVVHILGVNPLIQAKGFAKRIMLEVVEMARSNGMKAVRLDALCTNKPAQRLYEALNFGKRGVHTWYACNLGWDDFYLYEMNLGEN